MNPYYTHRESLIRELNNLDYTKNVVCLEFGAGHGSSPIFKEFVKNNDKLMVHAYESHRGWYQKAVEGYSTKNYFFHYVEDWDVFFKEFRLSGFYDLVFVDQSPWEARLQTIECLKNNVGVFVLHDYCYFNTGVIDDIFSIGEGSFIHEKFHKDFLLTADVVRYPPTLILRSRKVFKKFGILD